MKEFECTVSFTYFAEDEVEAAKQFYYNLHFADWYIKVKNLSSAEISTVDTETWESE